MKLKHMPAPTKTAPDVFHVWPENWHIWSLWREIGDQVQLAPSGALMGLRAEAVLPYLRDACGYTGAALRNTYNDLRLIMKGCQAAQHQQRRA